MDAAKRPIPVAAWLAEGADALQHACAGLERIALRIVHDEDALIRCVPECEVLVLSGAHYTARLARALDTSPRRVHWIQFASAGFDKAQEFGIPPGIQVTNAAAAFADTVAEHALALLLALVRCLPQAQRLREQAAMRREGLLPQLDTLDGQTLVIVGFGGIGRAVAHRARAFGMRIVVVARTPPTPEEGIAAVFPLSDIHCALRQADAVVLAVALVPATRHLIDAAALAALPSHARLINVARGPIVDEAALVRALERGDIAAAGLDVFAQEPLPADSPLRLLPNVLATPHVGGFGGPRVKDRLARLVAGNLQRHARGMPLAHGVNLACTADIH